MRAGAEDIVRAALLDNAAGIHDGDAAADIGDQAEIVADHQDGGASLGAQIPHQLDDLRLHGDVERGGRLVGDQEVRPACQRDGDHHALTHAARKLVRVFARPPLRRRNPHRAQHLHRLRPSLFARHRAVQQHRLGDLLADGHHRLE